MRNLTGSQEFLSDMGIYSQGSKLRQASTQTISEKKQIPLTEELTKLLLDEAHIKQDRLKKQGLLVKSSNSQIERAQSTSRTLTQQRVSDYCSIMADAKELLQSSELLAHPGLTRLMPNHLLVKEMWNKYKIGWNIRAIAFSECCSPAIFAANKALDSGIYGQPNQIKVASVLVYDKLTKYLEEKGITVLYFLVNFVPQAALNPTRLILG